MKRRTNVFRRGIMLLALHRIAVLIVTVGMASCFSALRSAGAVWDVTVDFTVDNGNPNSAWTYGWLDINSTFSLYESGDYSGYYGSPVWYTSSWGPHWPPFGYVWKNASGETLNGASPGQLSLHMSDAGWPCVIRWTCPAGVSGLATIAGEFFPGDGAQMCLGVDFHGYRQWSGLDFDAVNDDFNLVTLVAPGDTIDFVVNGNTWGSWAEYTEGNTPLDATITVIPEPCTWALVALGFGLMIMTRRRPSPSGHPCNIRANLIQFDHVLFGVLVALCISSGTTQAQSASFQGLGDLPGGNFSSAASGVSADGSTVAGYSGYAPGSPAFRWTSADGVQSLGVLPGGEFFSAAYGISADGSTIVGGSYSPSSPQAFRWTSAGGMQGLGDLPGGSESEAYGVNADGSVVAGYSLSASGYEAFRWTSTSGMQGLGELPGGDFYSYAYAVSADGSTIVGQGHSASGPEAFRWTSAGGMQGLGDLLGGSFDSIAYGISADGSTIVGYGYSAHDVYEAFRWTSADGMQSLGDLPSGFLPSSASAVSADGSIIVGSIYPASGQEAFIWDRTNGMRRLYDMLQNDYGLSLTGWTLTEASGISADGNTIVGYGVNPSGQTEAWIAQIPEPNTWALVVLGFGLIIRRRRLAHRKERPVEIRFRTKTSDPFFVAAILLAWSACSQFSYAGIDNGDFTAGNTLFTSDYAFIADPVMSESPGTYAVRTDPQSFNPALDSFGDHTSGSGNMMLVDGGWTAGMNVWSQTIAVIPNTTYIFSAWGANTSVAAHEPPILHVEVNDIAIGSDLTLSTTLGTWEKFDAIWNSGESSTAIINFFDENTTGYGNDFALDDISLEQVPEPSTWALVALGFGLMMIRRLAHRQ